jgi:O-antigen ligase
MTVQLALYMMGSAGGLARWTTVALAGMAMASLLVRGQLRWQWDKLDVGYILLTAWLLLSMLWSPEEEGYKASKTQEWFTNATMLYILPRFLIHSVRDTESLGRALVIAGGVLALFGLSLHFQGRLQYRGGRMWTLGDPLAVARLAWVAVLCAFYGAIRGGSWFRAGSLIVAATAGWLGLVTGSRGPLASAMLAAFVMWLFVRGGTRRLGGTLVVGAVVLVLAVGLLSYVPKASLDRLETLKTATAESSGRSMLYEKALMQGIESAGLGGGWASYPTVGGHKYCHNIILELWGELGAVGLALVGWMGVVGVGRLIRLYRDTRHDRSGSLLVMLTAGISCFGLAQAMTTADLPAQNGIWLGLGMLACRREVFLGEPAATYELHGPALSEAYTA